MVVKLLLVDDEEIQRTYLKEMLLDMSFHFDIEIIGEASNGWDALLLLECYKPDVIFLDVDMPTMDGLTMLEKVHEQGYTCKTVIVSGHNNFNFACKAMTNGAKSYLLKPISQNKIQEILDDIYEQLKEEKQRLREINNLYKQLEDQLPIIKHDLLHNLLSQSTSLDALSPSQLPLLNINVTSNKLVVLAVESNDSSSLVTYLKNYVYDLYKESNKISIVIIDLQSKGISQLETDLEVWLRQCATSNYSPPTMSMTAPLQFSELHSGYIEALKALELKTPKDTNTLIKCNNALPPRGYKTLTWQLKQKIHLYLVSKKEVELVAFLENVYQEYKNEELTLMNFRILSLELLSLGSAHLSNLGLQNFNRFQENQSHIVTINKLTSFKAVESYVIQYYKEILLQTTKKPTKKINDLTLKAIGYIEENYMKTGLSLDKIANALFVHPVYLSSQFKKNTNITITQYISDIRMEKALSLLSKDKDFSIANLALEVGYDNPYYFSKVFKKYYGSSPKNINISC